jgi:hypothetical protein
MIAQVSNSDRFHCITEKSITSSPRNQPDETGESETR